MKKLMVMMGAAGLAMASLAAVNDTLLTFSTPGTDKYADGTTVLDGECYALVWSADGNFEGIKADGTTVDANDKVVLVAPIAKDGKCPPVLFQIDAAEAETMKDGQYGVYLLDTRVKAADGTVTVAKNGILDVVNGAVAAGDSRKAPESGMATTVAVSAAAVAGGAVAVETIIDQPTITAIKANGAQITISVAGMSPAAQYKVVTGAKPGELATEIDATADAKGNFTFAKPEGTFFKVIGVRNF